MNSYRVLAQATMRRMLTGASALALVLLVATSAYANDDADRGDLVVIDGGMAQVSLYGLVAGQVAAYTGTDNLLQDGDPAERMGVRLRRARLGFQGWAFGQVEFAVSVEAAELHVALLDAWIAYRPFSFLNVRLGAQKVPFSRFGLTSSARGSLIERPLGVKALAPFRQLGLAVEGSIGDGLASYGIGVFNGFERHTNFHEGYVENPGVDGNRFNRLAVAGRVSLEPLGPIGSDIADLDGGGLRLAVGSSLFYNDGETTRTTGWEADIHLKVAGFYFLAEYIADSSEPQTRPTTPLTLPAKSDRFGVVGETGYMLLPGQLGLAARAEWYDDNEALENTGDAIVVTGGMQYYWHRHHFKLGLDFVHREELHGVSRDNDTLLLQVHLSL